ncbi:MAG: Maf family protein [Bacteroidia bacterium]|nr:Maf family protein [Bacteroidia bacterium]MDW8158508.1 Maf family protein [Bacteroidia bacterium]
MFFPFPPILLASQSPRRKDILEKLGLAFEVLASEIEESYPPGLPPEEIAIFLAQKKALFFKEFSFDKVVLGLDTLVCLENCVLGKPANAQEATSMLNLLAGKAHQVITGVCILWKDICHTFYEKTTVYFNSLTPAEIEYYITHFQPYDKAGSYGAQDWMGLVAIQKVEGDFYNVIGLPANRLLKELKLIL